MPLGNCPASARPDHLVPAIERMALRAWRFSSATSLPPAATARSWAAYCSASGPIGWAAGAPARAACQLVGGLAGLDAADEALQPLLLLVVEFAHARSGRARAGTRWRA